MKVLITGATGQLAQALSTCSRPAVTLLSMGRPELDVCKPSSVARALETMRPDVVINAAAYTQVDAAEQASSDAHRTNSEGAGTVALEASKVSCPIIQLSTDYVFDGSTETDYLEIDPPAPLNVYGASKLASEIAVAAANPHHVIVRTSWVYSPYAQNFVKTMLRLAAQKNEITVVDDQIGCPTSAKDLASCLVDLSLKITSGNFEHWGTYHLAGSGSTSWAGFAREIFAISSKYGGPSARVQPVSTEKYPTPAERPRRSVLNCDKAHEDLGLELPAWQTSLATCVKALV